MAFKMKGFPMHKGVSPMREQGDPSSGDQSSFIEGEDSSTNNTVNVNDNTENVTTDNTKNGTTDNTKNTTSNTDWSENITRAEYEKFLKLFGGNIVKKDAPPPPKDEEKGIDRWIDKPIMEVLGLTKEQREARKLKKSTKKTENLKAANEAIESGTQTLKQQKLVDRTNRKNLKKENKALEKRTKDQAKLAKYKERQAKKNIIKTDYTYPNTTT